MTQFRYRAAGPDGQIVAGSITAGAAAEVDAVLLSRGLHPLSLESSPGTSPSAPRRDLAILFRSLATLVGAGVPLERALASSERLPRSLSLRTAITESRRLLLEGHSLTEAFSHAEGAVPGVVLGILRAGERGSRLGEALEQAATQLEQEAELLARVRQALAYPAVLLVAGVCSLGVIIAVVVPRFAVLLSDLGQSLPPATRVLLTGSALLQRYAPLLSIGGLLGGALGLSWARSADGRRQFHRVLLSLPLLGMVRHNLATARAVRALGSLLATGVPILPALHAARDAAGDAEVAVRLGQVGRRVSEGEGLTAALMAERAVSPTALQVLGVGDASGRLARMALRAGDLAAMEAEGGLRVLVSLLEPALVVVFGGLVAFTAAALLQAVYSLRPA